MFRLTARSRHALVACALVVGAAAPAVAQDEPPAPPDDAATDDAATDDASTGDGADGDDAAPDDELTDEEGPWDEGSGDDPSGDPDDPPPPPSCPTGLIVTQDGACVDPDRLAELLAGYEAAAEEEAEALEALSQAITRLHRLERRLERLETRVAGAQLRYTSASADAAYAALRQEVVAGSLGDVEAALDVENQRLRDQAVEAYIAGGDESALEEAGRVLEADSVSDVEVARQYADVVFADQLDTLDRIDALEAAVVALGEQVELLQAAAEADVDTVVALEEQLAELVETQRDLVTRAEAQSEELADHIAQIQEQKAEYAAELEISAAGGGSIGQILRDAQQGQQPPERSTGIFASPLIPFSLASPYGPRMHPIFGVMRMHTGADLNGGAGQPIYAAGDGVVLLASEQGGYGNTVVVDHGNGLGTLYAHQSAMAVKVGQVVEAGDLLGYVGSTGYSTGPHLHFEVRVFGEPVDPLPYVDLGDDDEDDPAEAAGS